NILKRNIRFMTAIHKEIRSGHYDVVFIQYTRGVSLVRLFNLHQKTIFDVRTLSIERNSFKRFIYNSFLKIESLFFKNHSIISEGLAKQLSLRKYFLLP